jgi:hypothetical protein
MMTLLIPTLTASATGFFAGVSVSRQMKVPYAKIIPFITSLMAAAVTLLVCWLLY